METMFNLTQQFSGKSLTHLTHWDPRRFHMTEGLRVMVAGYPTPIQSVRVAARDMPLLVIRAFLFFEFFYVHILEGNLHTIVGTSCLAPVYPMELLCLS